MAKIELRLRASIVEHEGRIMLKFANPDYYRDQMEKLRGYKNAVVTVSNLGVGRSNNQNSYWHGVCYPVLAELTGYSVAETKELTKQMFITPKVMEVNNVEYEVRRGTSELEKWEGVDYTEAMIALAIELGGKIPSPEDAGYHIVRG